MILTLSPYYINIPFASPLTGLTCSQYTLKIYVWSGLKNAPPSEPTYEITKINPEQLNTVDKIDIGRLVNSLIDFSFVDVAQTELVNGMSASWVKTEVYYKTPDASEINLPQSQLIQLATKGYGNGIDGENQQTPNNKVLINAREFKVSTDSKVVIPILIDESVIPTPYLTIDSIVSNGGDSYTLSYTHVGSYNSLSCSFVVTPNPNNELAELLLDENVNGIIDFNFSGSGSYNFTLYGFDNNMAVSVTSPIFNITL